jgi:hypothetical protein
MRRALACTALLVALLAGCGDDGGDDEAADTTTTTEERSTTTTEEDAGGEAGEEYPAEVQRTVLDSCLTSARAAAGAQAPEDVLVASCECALQRIQEEFSLDEFTDLEQRITAGTATDAEAGRLTNIGVECAREVQGGGASTTTSIAGGGEAA